MARRRGDKVATGALHRKFSFHTRKIDCLVDRPIAVAMSAVLQTKYAVAAPTSGLGQGDEREGDSPGGAPPSQT
jgi:hypothetical protein